VIYLASTDTLRLTTSAAITVDVLVGYVDLVTATGVATPGRQRTNITIGAVTTILAAPAAGSVRSAKSLSIRNKHATTAVDVTLDHYDGATAVEILKATLPAGHTLVRDETSGWILLDSRGRKVELSDFTVGSAAVNALNLGVLASDVTNNNAVANAIADITGLSFAVVAGETYWFRFVIHYTAAATTTGARFAVNGPAFSFLGLTSSTPLVNTAQSTDSISTTNASAYDVPATANASSPTATAGQTQVAIIEGVIRPSASGTLIARFASEVASSAIVAKAGSHVQWVRTL
jgi:hypothetical protein